MAALVFISYCAIIASMRKLSAKPRTIFGKKTKAIRRRGEIPAVLYGSQEESKTISVSEREFAKVWREAGESSLVELDLLDGGIRNVLIHDVMFDPVHDQPVHVDFYVVRMDKLIETTVPLVFEGESEAIKALGGVLVKVIHELEIEALPRDLPHEIVVDISKLRVFEDRILVADISLPGGVTTKIDPEAVIALVEAPRSEEELASLETKAEVSLDSIEIAGKKEKVEEEESSENPS